MCAETDYMLGTVIDELHDLGFDDDTWIIFLSDHGEMNMEHRQVWKNSMYEVSLRVPLVIAPPASMKDVQGEPGHQLYEPSRRSFHAHRHCGERCL